MTDSEAQSGEGSFPRSREAFWAPACWCLVQHGVMQERAGACCYCCSSALERIWKIPLPTWRSTMLLQVARNVKAKPQSYLDAPLLVFLNWWLLGVLFSEECVVLGFLCVVLGGFLSLLFWVFCFIVVVFVLVGFFLLHLFKFPKWLLGNFIGEIWCIFQLNGVYTHPVFTPSGERSLLGALLQ